MMEPDNNASGINPAAGFGTFGDSPTPASEYDDDALAQAKRKVEDVTSIMGQNVQRVIARGDNLEDLDQRASTLTANASEFQRTSRTLKRKMWWQNTTRMLIIGLVVLIIIVVIIIAAVGVPKSGGGSSTVTTTPAP